MSKRAQGVRDGAETTIKAQGVYSRVLVEFSKRPNLVKVAINAGASSGVQVQV